MNSYPPGWNYNDADSPQAEAWEAAIEELSGIEIDPVLMVRLVSTMAGFLRTIESESYRMGYNDGITDGEAKAEPKTCDRCGNSVIKTGVAYCCCGG